MSVDLVLMVFAFVLFVLATFNVPRDPKVNLVAAGLACWIATFLF